MNDRRKKLRFSLLVLPLLFLSPARSFAAEAVGSVTAVQKEARVARDGKSALFLVKGGDPVLFRDTYRTGIQSKIKMLFEDDSILSLGEKSEIQITENIYDPADNKRSMTAQVLSGSLRALVGKIFSGSGSKFEIHTPTAVAAARGTYFIVWLTEIDGKPATGVVGLQGEVAARNVDAEISREVLLTEKLYTLIGEGRFPTPPSVIPPDLLAGLTRATEVEDRVEEPLANVEEGEQVDIKGAGLPILFPAGLGAAPNIPPIAQEPIQKEFIARTPARVEIQFP